MDSLLLLAQARPGANAAIVAFGCYIVGVMFLAWLSSRVAQRSSFLSEYFLGGRSLGVWAFALTFTGLVIGVWSVGLLNDYFAIEYGAKAVRYSMALVLLAALPSALLIYQAGKTVDADRAELAKSIG